MNIVMSTSTLGFQAGEFNPTVCNNAFIFQKSNIERETWTRMYKGHILRPTNWQRFSGTSLLPMMMGQQAVMLKVK